MQMTDDEIRRVYKSAKNKKKQIGILAELNCCGTGKILDIIHIPEGFREPIRSTESKHVKKPVSKLEKNPDRIALLNRLDELDAMIKPLEDEYRRTAAELMSISK